MKPTSIAAAAILAISLCAAPAWAGSPGEHFVLTPALVQKVKAVKQDLGDVEETEAEKKEADKHRKDGMLPVEYYIRVLETKPGIKGTLAKHGLTPKEFGLSEYALVHGAMYLGMETAVDKKAAAEMMGKFTREQQANIALLRKMGPVAYTLN